MICVVVRSAILSSRHSCGVAECATIAFEGVSPQPLEHVDGVCKRFWLKFHLAGGNERRQIGAHEHALCVDRVGLTIEFASRVMRGGGRGSRGWPLWGSLDRRSALDGFPFAVL